MMLATVFVLATNALTTGRPGPQPVADYVTIDLQYPAFEAARHEVESRVGHSLKHRGEAHVTVISPPEFKILSKFLSPKEIREIVESNIDFKNTDASPVCVGQGVLAASETWFVVISMPSAQNARHVLEKRFVKKGGTAREFKPDEFYPHVTLGFTTRDLHLQDGVVKDSTSCKFPIHR